MKNERRRPCRITKNCGQCGRTFLHWANTERFCGICLAKAPKREQRRSSGSPFHAWRDALLRIHIPSDDERPVSRSFAPTTDGEWIQWPINRTVKMSCCDCGKVHKLRFRILEVRSGRQIRGVKVQMQPIQDKRATAAHRRTFPPTLRLRNSPRKSSAGSPARSRSPSTSSRKGRRPL